MFANVFEKFKKSIAKKSQTQDELQREFDQVKINYASLATSDLYKLFKEYFTAKIELNRDDLEREKDLNIINRKQAEILVYRSVMEDIEGMYEMMLQEQPESKL